MPKQGIKGFSGLRFFPVTTNSASVYAVGAKTDIPTAVSATNDRKAEDYSLPGDDGIYDSGAEFTGETWEIVVQELPLPLMAALDGADYDDVSKIYTWGPDAIAPEIAFAFRALKRDGTYRMIQYYSAKVTDIKTEYKTRTDNKDGSRYTISLAVATRMVDGKMFRAKDSVTAADLAWLETIAAIPEVLGTLVLQSVEGSATGKTKVFVAPSIPSGQTAKYKTAATVELPAYDDDLTIGWTTFVEGADIVATTGDEIAVAFVDADSKAKSAGKTIVASKA